MKKKPGFSYVANARGCRSAVQAPSSKKMVPKKNRGSRSQQVARMKKKGIPKSGQRMWDLGDRFCKKRMSSESRRGDRGQNWSS